jgi:hypothetical protein
VDVISGGGSGSVWASMGGRGDTKDAILRGAKDDWVDDSRLDSGGGREGAE